VALEPHEQAELSRDETAPDLEEGKPESTASAAVEVLNRGNGAPAGGGTKKVAATRSAASSPSRKPTTSN
jgi:hypothetical protein